jgi:hypothetical protein
VRESQPPTRAVADAVDGKTTPAEAAARVQTAVEALGTAGRWGADIHTAMERNAP